MAIQAKLLRALETKTFQRMGGQEQIKVDVRVIAATNKRLEEEIKKGQFREDLYYRFKGFEITLPPLRERGEDILLLALYFLKRFAEENPIVKAQTISPQVAAMLLEHPWDGNVRELKNVIERAAIASEETKLIPEDFEGIFDLWTDSAKLQIRSLDKIKGEVARMRYESEGKDYTKAANSLDINQRTLKSWLKKYEAPGKPENEDLQVSIAQFSSWEEIECEVIRKTLEYTKNSNPKAAEILGIALSTFLKNRRKCGI